MAASRENRDNYAAVRELSQRSLKRKSQREDIYARREDWRNSGQDYFAARITEPGRRPKNGDVVSGEWIDSGHRREGDRHLLHYGPSRRDTLRRRARSDDSQGRKNGHMDWPRCRNDEERRDCELSRSGLLSKYAATLVPVEQGRGGIRIRGRRSRQHALRILGMEVACS